MPTVTEMLQILLAAACGFALHMRLPFIRQYLRRLRPAPAAPAAPACSCCGADNDLCTCGLCTLCCEQCCATSEGGVA